MMRQEAQRLAHWGAKVFPCHGKKPLQGSRGLLDAKSTDAPFDEWWPDSETRNVAIAFGAVGPNGKVLFGIDIDPRHDGITGWVHWIAGREVPHTVQAQTGRGDGGVHMYFFAPAGWTKFPKSPARGVDCKGPGGYFMAPPSLHPDTNEPYHWDVEPWTNPVADAPQWMLDEFERMCGPSSTPRETPDAPAYFVTGERNNMLTSLAGSMRRRGMKVNAIDAALQVENQETCRPPLDPREVRKIAESAERNMDAADPVVPGALTNSDVDFDLDGEDEPVKWLCEGLRLASGRPSVWVGEGGTGKSLMAHWLGLCVADGRPFLGREVRQGRVLYVDFDGQGKRLTKRRHQRMARAMGLDVGVLKREQRFGYLFRPKREGKPVHLDSYEREQAFADLIAGYDLVIIDSLRRCAPRLNEDKPEASMPLEIAASISERTGQVFIFLDHAGKPNADPSAQKSRRHVQRGSSAKRDGSGTQVVMSNTKGKPTLVTCERDQETGKEFPDFAIQFVDVASLGDPEHALALREVPTDSSGIERASTRIKKEILEYVKAHPGCSWAQVRADVPGKDTTKKAMLDELMEERRLTNLGSDKKGDYRAV